MKTEYHMRIDVRGVLSNWNPREWSRCVIDPETGALLSAVEVHERFLDALAAGKKYLPLGAMCEGWSDETGCPGHDVSGAPLPSSRPERT